MLDLRKTDSKTFSFNVIGSFDEYRACPEKHVVVGRDENSITVDVADSLKPDTYED